MPRTSLLSLLPCLIALLAGAGCATEANGASCDAALTLHLRLPAGGTVQKVQYTISGNDIEEIEGTINVSAPQSTASVEVYGIPPGTNYLFEMSATSVDGTESCWGSSWFDVTVGVSTQIDVVMRCKGAEQYGGVRVNGVLNVCAELTRVVVSPLQTGDGFLIDVEAQAEDVEGDDIRYRWTATAGDFYYHDERITRFDCNDAGENETIRIAVSDDNFVHCSDAWTVDVSCVDGTLPGAGGVGGAGVGGAGGSDGSAGGGGEGGSISIDFRASTEDQCTVSLGLR